MSQDQVLRTGVLFKKGSGNGPFGRKNWKPRYFVLTPTRLKYYTFEDGDLKGEVDLSGCDENMLEVMPADSMKTGSSASTIWRIAINAPGRRLLVAAGTEMEMNDWVDKLVLAFRISSGQPMPAMDDVRASTYSPGDGRIVQGSSNPVITDFQNFAAARRSVAVNMNRHSVGSHAGSDPRHSDQELHHDVQLVQADQLKQQQQRQRQEQLEHEQARRQQQEAEAAMHAEAERQQQEEQAAAAAAAAAEAERQHQIELEAQRQRQQEEEEARRSAARQSLEKRDQEMREKKLTDELELQQSLKGDQMHDLLDLQRRQKREEHERQRKEREQQILQQEALKAAQAADLEERQRRLTAQEEERASLRAQQEEQKKQEVESMLDRQRREKREKHEREREERLSREKKPADQQEFDDLEFRMTAQLQQQQYFDVDNESEDSDDEPERSPYSTQPPASAPVVATAPVVSTSPVRSTPIHDPAPRSSLIDDVKREAIMKQQAEHQRRREQSLQQEKHKHELEQQRAKLEAATLGGQHEVSIVRDSQREEIEVVRRPIAKPAPQQQVMESVEF